MPTLPLTTIRLTLVRLLALLCASGATAAASQPNLPAKPTGAAPGLSAKGIPWDQLGAKAGAGYRGDGLTVTPTAEGARLHCVFQQLDGEATRQGLWLTSTVSNGLNAGFRVRAVAVGRGGGRVEPEASERQGVESTPHGPPSHAPRLPQTGTVTIAGQMVRWSRLGLMEEVLGEYGRGAAGFCGDGETAGRGRIAGGAGGGGG